MFYGLFNSGTFDYRNQRIWILRVILDGLATATVSVHALFVLCSLLRLTVSFLSVRRITRSWSAATCSRS